MSSRILRTSLAVAMLSMGAAPASAADVLGTLTVNGKTMPLKHAVATIEKNPNDSEGDYLVVLLSDVPVPPADRTPARLLELARANRVHAVRVLWLTTHDWVRAVPYDARVAESGVQAPERPTINIRALDDRRIDIDCRSKMLGQPWHFHASVKAPLERKSTPVELEPEPASMTTAVEQSEEAGTTDPTAIKRRLGALGYEFTPEMFTHAVKDGQLEAVRLFLKLGTSPNTKDSQGNHMMVIMAMMCDREPAEQRLDLLKTMIAAGGDVNAADMNKSTPLIWAAQSCDEEFVEALIKAGANVNARAAGGATPLMMATVMGRTEVAAMLKRAGARE